MFIEKTRRLLRKFNLDDESDRLEMESLSNDPNIRVISKKLFTETDSSSSEDAGSFTSTRLNALVEYEECFL